MGEQVIRRGHDTFIESAHPDREHGDSKYPQVVSAAARTLLFMPLEGVKGRTILSATLTGRVRNAFPAQTLTVQAISEKWSAAWANWNKQPAVLTPSATLAVGALADGASFEVNITALVQTVANGGDHFGWRIKTDSTTGGRFYGFDSGDDSWTLTVVTSDAPQEPTTLYPAGGVVGIPVWTVSCDFTDLGGSTDMSAIQVQVDNYGDADTPDYDSGWVPSTVPELDLSRTDLPGGIFDGIIAAGLSMFWRVQVKDGDGLASGWSDWVEVTYIPKPNLVLDNPASGILADATTTISAHITTGTLQAWEVRIADGDDKTATRYQAKRDGSGTAIACDLPVKNDDGDRVFKDDGTYWLLVRAWDRLDRLRGGAGDPPYVESWTQVTFDDDLALSPVSTLNVSQIGDTPRVRLSWSRTAGAADGWAIYRDDERLDRVDAADITASGGSYEWIDDSATPNRWHTYKVKAVTNGVQSVAGPLASIRPEVDGVWLLSPQGDVVFEGEGIGGLRSADRRATYSLPNQPYDVDIVGAIGGIAGTFAGTIDVREDRPDVDEARRIIRAIRRKPTQTVRLVYANRSIPVLLRDPGADPSENYNRDYEEHDVAFGVQQVGDFESTL